MQIWQKQNEKIDMYNFLVHDCTRKQNGSPYLSSMARQSDGRFYRERMLRSKNFATMVTLRHTSPLCTTEIKSQNLSKQTFILVIYLQFYFTPSFLYLHARQ